MNNNLFEFDLKIRKDYKVNIISGSDESGRGAMAGPIVVASVILPKDYQNPEIMDSKKIKSEKKRQKIYQDIIKNALSYNIFIINSKDVDKMNPKQASKFGMQKTIENLNLIPDIALTDAENISLLIKIKTLNLIKGDDKSLTIAAASILAKVTRDNIMNHYELKYPEYNFSSHKGYCTKKHYLELEQNGVLDIHRKSYAPIKKYLKK